MHGQSLFRCRSRPVPADLKSILIRRFSGIWGDRCHPRIGRAVVTGGDHAINRRCRATEQRLDTAIWTIAHPTVQPQGTRLLFSPGAKPDTLDLAFDTNLN